jgi:hypothetical protein
MIHTLFYICGIIYYLQLWFINDFNPVGKEFANVVILGLIAISTNNGSNK